MRGRNSLRLVAASVVALAGSLGVGAVAGPGANPQADATPVTAIQLAQAVDQATLVREGGPLYAKTCAACHGARGEGGAGPKLVGFEFLASKGAVIGQIFYGNEDHGMPGFHDTLKDREVAAIATYVRNSWGNNFGVVLPAEVAGAR